MEQSHELREVLAGEINAETVAKVCRTLVSTEELRIAVAQRVSEDIASPRGSDGGQASHSPSHMEAGAAALQALGRSRAQGAAGEGDAGGGEGS